MGAVQVCTDLSSECADACGASRMQDAGRVVAESQTPAMER